MTSKTAAQLIQDAKAHIDNRTPDQVQAELDAGNVTLVDIRYAPELSQGTRHHPGRRARIAGHA